MKIKKETIYIISNITISDEMEEISDIQTLNLSAWILPKTNKK